MFTMYFVLILRANTVEGLEMHSLDLQPTAHEDPQPSVDNTVQVKLLNRQQ